MLRRLRIASFALLCATAACGDVLSRSRPVTTADQATELAKAALIGTPQAIGPFKVVRAGATWNVSAPPAPTGSVTVYVSAKTGQAVVYTDEGTKRADP
jgi:hypothetical protein